MQDRLHGRGRTPREAIEYFSAVADIEDRKRAAKLERDFQLWQQHQNDLATADTSAPSEADLAELQEMQARAERFRQRKYDQELTLRAAAAERRAERSAARKRWAGLFG
jgi:hypothetical protein